MPKYIRCISSCSVVSFKSKLDCYLKNIIDLPGRPGLWRNLQWCTLREDQAFQLDAAEQPQVSIPCRTELDGAPRV